MTIGLGHYLTVAAILFTLGVFGIFLNRKNVIIILMAVELILLVAMIGAIVLTLRHKVGIKRQNIAVQVARTPATAVEVLTNVQSGQGLS